MNRHCTTCGAAIGDGHAFCERCGAPRGAPAAPAARAATPPAAPLRRRRLLVAGATAAVLATLAVTWWLQPPAPSPRAFLAALRDAPEAAGAPPAQQLCVSAMRHDGRALQVAEHDLRTRHWMAQLVAAGLYSEAAPAAARVRYEPTPELSRWVRDGRLCVAARWAPAEVGTPTADPRGGTREIFRGTAVWQAEDVAPWLGKTPLLRERLHGLKGEGGRLTADATHLFERRGRQWVALTAPELQALRHLPAMREVADAGAERGGGWLGNLFGVGGHPLLGRWRAEGSSLLGGQVPGPLGGVVTFSRDAIESEGQRMPASFRQDGDTVVAVLGNGQFELRFLMKGRDRAELDLGAMAVSYRRER